MRPGAVLWAMVGAVSSVLMLVGPSRPTAAQIPFPTTIEPPFPTVTEQPPNTAPAVTPLRPPQTVAVAPIDQTTSTEVLRRLTTTTSETTTTSTTLATISPTPGATGVADTTPPARTGKGQGEMPSWPLWLFGIGAGGTVSIMGTQYVKTRPGKR
jgi:hypothetical protein